MNYRLRIPLNFGQRVRECGHDRLNYLFNFDELREQQRLRKAFMDFHECMPNFRPTYKYDIGTSNWDSRLIL